MKKILIFAILLMTFTLVFVSCDDRSKLKNENISYFLDGTEITSIPQDKAFVAFVRPKTDEQKRAIFDYDINDLQTVSIDQNVYLFSVDKLYGSYEELESSLDSLEIGQKVGIKHYYADIPRGASIYEVVENNSKKELKIIPFTVGEDKILTVDMYGAYGDGVKSDNAAITKAFRNTDANYFEFESDYYLQTYTISLKRSNITVDGCGAEIDNRYDYVFDKLGNLKKYSAGSFYNFDGTVGNDFLISGSDTKYLENVTLKNLKIVCTEMRGVGSLYNRIKEGAHSQLSIQYVNNLTISGCEFIVPERTGIGKGIVDGTGNMKEEAGEIINVNIGCISISQGANNVVVENNKMINFGGGYAGVTFGISWGNHSNYIIRNNYIEKSNHDEIFTIYGCELFDTAEIYGNTYKSHDEPIGNASQHPLGFGANAIEGFVKNVKFHDNILDAVSCFDGMIFEECENIEIYNNDLSIKPNSKDQPILYGFFRISNNKYTTTQKNVYIHDNKITIRNSYKVPMNYNCNSGFVFENNEFNMILE